MLKQKYFLTGIFILSAERQPIKLAWRKIVWLHIWAIEDIVAYNNDYGIHKYLQKEYLAFGMDGDIGYIFHLPNNSIYRVDLGDLDIASIKYIAPSFDDFLGKAIYLNFDKPQNIVDNSSTI